MKHRLRALEDGIIARTHCEDYRPFHSNLFCDGSVMRSSGVAVAAWVTIATQLV
jgi:hypothetical protein